MSAPDHAVNAFEVTRASDSELIEMLGDDDNAVRQQAADELRTRRPADDTPTPLRFRLARVGDMEVKPPRFIVRDVLEADSLALAFGDPGCGKSFLGVDVACCVATGTDFHEHEAEPGAVIYVAGEGRNGLARRFRAWQIARGISLDDAPLYASATPASLCDPESARDVVDAVDDIAERDQAPTLVVIDTVARNFGPGDENSTQDMAGFIQACDRIRTSHGSTVLLIHHTGHHDKTRARGAMALKGALDAEYRLDKDEHGVIRLEATKMKDAEDPEPMAFRLATVELGMQDNEGREVTSAVLETTGYEPPAQKGRQGRGKWQTVALEQLERLYRRHRAYVEADGRNPDTARVSVDAWRDACTTAGMPKQRWAEVRRNLIAQQMVSIEHGFVFPS